MSEGSRATYSGLVTLLTAVLSGLALGALWALLAASGVDHVLWLALGTAAGMALSMRFSSPRPEWLAGILAGLGTLLAAFYAECLQLLMRIATQLGLPLIEVIRTSGIMGTSQLAWRLMPASHIVLYLVGAVLAFFFVVWPSRKPSQE